jgi:hypothetical protein
MQFFDFGDEDGSGALDMIEAKHLMTSAGHSQPHLEAALQAHVSGSVVLWEKHTDPGSGNNFYFNRETNESAWDPPDDFVGAHEGESDKELSKDEFVEFIKSTKAKETSIADEIDYIYAQIWYLKELRTEHANLESKWETALGNIFKLMDTDDSGSVDMELVKKLFLSAGCPAEHLQLAAAMVMETMAASGVGEGDGSLDKVAFIAFGKTTNGADDTIENFIASLYFEVAKLIVADFKDVGTDGGGEQKGDAGERDVIRMTVDTTVR